eukprot:TRINITY_DN6713_c4_g1_i1.p1 TRINITY_DN6713_c4_g1~~TRINITY_DN6713_c4_g1_i1.p1  ORF type:complete len:1360 (+),score=391.58 TRINITY_DN6713_c4_g1_i1:55-4134(+)
MSTDINSSAGSSSSLSSVTSTGESQRKDGDSDSTDTSAIIRRAAARRRARSADSSSDGSSSGDDGDSSSEHTALRAQPAGTPEPQPDGTPDSQVLALSAAPTDSGRLTRGASQRGGSRRRSQQSPQPGPAEVPLTDGAARSDSGRRSHAADSSGVVQSCATSIVVASVASDSLPVAVGAMPDEAPVLGSPSSNPSPAPPPSPCAAAGRDAGPFTPDVTPATPPCAAAAGPTPPPAAVPIPTVAAAPASAPAVTAPAPAVTAAARREDEGPPLPHSPPDPAQPPQQARKLMPVKATRAQRLRRAASSGQPASPASVRSRTSDTAEAPRRLTVRPTRAHILRRAATTAAPAGPTLAAAAEESRSRWGLTFADPTPVPARPPKQPPAAKPRQRTSASASPCGRLASPGTSSAVVNGGRRELRARIGGGSSATSPQSASGGRLHVPRLRAAFAMMDISEAGVLSRQQLRRALRHDPELRHMLKVAGLSATDSADDPSLAALFAGSDSDGHRNVTYSVFEKEVLRVVQTVAPSADSAAHGSPSGDMLQESIRERQMARDEKQLVLADLESFLSRCAAASPDRAGVQDAGWERRRVLGKAIHSRTVGSPPASDRSGALGSPEASQQEEEERQYSCHGPGSPTHSPPPPPPPLRRESWRAAQKQARERYIQAAAAQNPPKGHVVSRLFDTAVERQQQKEKWADIERSKREQDGVQELTFVPRLNPASVYLQSQAPRQRDPATRLPVESPPPPRQRHQSPARVAFGSGLRGPAQRRTVRSSSAPPRLPERLGELAKPKAAIEVERLQEAVAEVAAKWKRPDPSLLQKRRQSRAGQPDLWTALYREGGDQRKRRQRDDRQRLLSSRETARVGAYLTETTHEIASRRRRSRLAQLFGLLDIHGRGVITQEEVQRAVTALGSKAAQGITRDTRERAILSALKEAAALLGAADDREFDLVRFLDVVEPRMGRRGPVTYLTPIPREPEAEPPPPFAPAINPESRRMSTRTETIADTHERLYQRAAGRSEWLVREQSKQRERQQRECTFQPAINVPKGSAACRSASYERLSAPPSSRRSRGSLWRDAAVQAAAGVPFRPQRWLVEGHPLNPGEPPETTPLSLRRWSQRTCVVPPSVDRERGEAVLADLVGCRIVLMGMTGSVVLERCEDCEVVVSACKGSVTLTQCTGLCLTVACKRLRVKRSRDLECFLHCLLPPKVSSSSGVVLRPFNAAIPGLRAAFALAGLQSTTVVPTLESCADYAVPDWTGVVLQREVCPPGYGPADAPSVVTDVLEFGSRHAYPHSPAYSNSVDVLDAMDGYVAASPRRPDSLLGSSDVLGESAGDDDVLSQIDAIVCAAQDWLGSYDTSGVKGSR